MPKVSICIPAYKNPGGIARLLASVMSQSYSDYEVIVTDDSPDEAVKAVVENCGIENIQYFKNRKRLGATANWNEAVRHAGGDYIKMMHHDDWFSQENSLAEFVAMLDRHPEVCLAFCGTWQVTLSETGEETKERFARHIKEEHSSLISEDWHNLFLGGYIGAPSATIYRRCGIEYEEQLKWLVDVEFYMRVLKENPKFVHTKEPLICIGISKEQLTEQCYADGKLNIFEYGFLYREFELQDDKRYRNKLIQVALTHKMPYTALKPYGISKGEYYKALLCKKWKDFLFLLTVVKRKLFQRER
jgi:glycosyltransferase involved in cell wall biosynthesis